MNRRNFLKLTAVGIASTAAPASRELAADKEILVRLFLKGYEVYRCQYVADKPPQDAVMHGITFSVTDEVTFDGFLVDAGYRVWSGEAYFAASPGDTITLTENA